MSILYKDIDSQNYNELNVGNDRITVEKIIEIIRKKEGLSDLEDISILNSNTREKLDQDQYIRSGTKVLYQLNDAFDGFDDENILEHVMSNKGPTQETPKPTVMRNYQRYITPKYQMKMPEMPKPTLPQKTAPPEVKANEDFSDNLKCMICKHTMKDAVQVPCCNQAYCDECIRKKSRCPNCGSEVNEDSIIPNKRLREVIEKNVESTIDEPSPTNGSSMKMTEPPSFEESKIPPPSERRESTLSISQGMEYEEESYPKPHYSEARPDYRPPASQGYYPNPMTPAPPMYGKPPPPVSRPGAPGFGGPGAGAGAGMYPPGFRAPGMGMYPPPYMGYPNPSSMYGGYPPMYGGYPSQMPPYMYGMRGMPNPYEGMEQGGYEMMDYPQQGEEEEEEEKSEKSKKQKKHKHRNEKKHSSDERSKSRSRSRSASKSPKRGKYKNRSPSASKKKHKKEKKHKR